MSAVGTITLNVYKLSETSSSETNGNFWTSRLLPSLGMGAYHTSISIGANHHFTFAARHGIVASRNEPTEAAIFQESIFLGHCHLHRGQVQEIVKALRKPFSETAYHLVHRNCNHFTETFALALLRHDDLIEGGNVPRLATYPSYVNRLAGTGAVFIGHDDDIVVRSTAPNETFHFVRPTLNTFDFSALQYSGRGGNGGGCAKESWMGPDEE